MKRENRWHEPSWPLAAVYACGTLLLALALALLRSWEAVSSSLRAMVSAALGLVLIFCALKAVRNGTGAHEIRHGKRRAPEEAAETTTEMEQNDAHP